MEQKNNSFRYEADRERIRVFSLDQKTTQKLQSKKCELVRSQKKYDFTASYISKDETFKVVHFKTKKSIIVPERFCDVFFEKLKQQKKRPQPQSKKKSQAAQFRRNSINFFRRNKNEELGAHVLLSSQDADNLYLQSRSLGAVPRSLIHLTSMSSYQSCQILIQEKAKVLCNTLYYSKEGKLITESLSNNDFNQVFNFVKKSKSKYLSQENLPNNKIFSIGTFLAKEFNLTNYRAIVILSREEFLPPEEMELHFFDLLVSTLSPILETLLIKESLSVKNESLLEILASTPLPLVVRNEKNKIVLKNELFETLNDKNSSPSLTVPLSRDHSLEVFDDQDNQNISDIYHYQRVSLLGELLNTLQHELSNPLFGINLSAELLSQEAPDDDTREILEEVSQNSARCQNIIKGFSELYQDKKTYSLVNLKKLLNESLTLSKSETRSFSRLIEFEKFTNPEEFTFLTNPTWLTQIIFNIIINAAQAIKSSPASSYQKGEISLLVKKNQESIDILISDNGPGIPKNKIRDVFSPFFTTKTRGTGLGLSICYNLVQKLGGNISAKNNTPKSGTTFIINLPLTKEDHP